MAVSPDYLDHLLDQFAGFGAVEARRMFGGVGIFRGGLMIALVSQDTLYFKADDASRGAFEVAGLAPFSFAARGRRMITSYYEAPAEVFDDPDVLAHWARSAHDAALRADRAKDAKAKPKAKPKRKAKPKPKRKTGGARPKARSTRKGARRATPRR